MGKIAIFSDLHLHPFSAFATVNKWGVQSRLAEIAAALQAVLRGAEEERCDAILFAGDFFHTKKIDIETLHIAAATLETVLPIYMIAGNHDEAGLFNAIGLFDGRANVLRENMAVTLENGINIRGIPFVSDGEKLRSVLDKHRPDILILHTGVLGASMGSDIVYDEGGAPTAEELTKISPLVVCGHFHEPQTIKTDTGTVLIPGAPIQHNFGDSGRRGWWSFDGGALLFHEIESPRFVTVMQEEVLRSPDALRGQYVRVQAADDLSDGQKDVLRESRGYSVVRVPRQTKIEARSEIKETMTTSDIISKYVELTKPPDPDKYLQIGRRFIS